MKPCSWSILFILLLTACSQARQVSSVSCPAVSSGYVTVSHGGQLYYESVGEGEPVLLLHGHTLDMYYGYEAWDSLKVRRPELPVLILSGEMEHKGKNPMLPYLPNGRQLIIPDCGHMSNMERPDEFNRLMLELIESCR